MSKAMAKDSASQEVPAHLPTRRRHWLACYPQTPKPGNKNMYYEIQLLASE